MAQATQTPPPEVAAGGTGSIPLVAGDARPRTRRRSTNLAARGEPMVWLTGGSVAACVTMIALLLIFVIIQGFGTFWPGPLVQIKTTQNKMVLGEPTRQDTYNFIEYLAKDATIPTARGMRHEIVKDDAVAERDNKQAVRFFVDRTLYKTGNFDTTGEDFTWVDNRHIAEQSLPQWGLVIERTAWGNAYGTLEGATIDGQTIEGAESAWQKFQEMHGTMRDLVKQARHIERHEMSDISHEQNEMRLELRAVELKHGVESQQYLNKQKELEPRQKELESRMSTLRHQTKELRQKMETTRLIIRTPAGQIIPADRSQPEVPITFAQIVRVYPANQLSVTQKIGVYLSRWWEYLSDEPREANTEGGVFPAIVGTILLTFIMIIFVVPVGVIAAIYLREYAKQGLIVSMVRISVNNLAGVPSIVFGVFGLGFFCYIVGANLDQLLFAEKLPDPTLGKSAMIWASLTLALLTLPLVIVATEEALAAVPRSMREGSYACGASKWQTIRRIVLPRAMPGVMTGMILAIARGAGEVAPLMLVGAVKLAPELPISGDPENLFGVSRSFMHLGFHIYDLGFQSRNSEAAKSMVYTTTLLLIGLVVTLNLTAIFIRSRLRKAYAGGQF